MPPIHFLLVDDEELFVVTIAKRLRLKGFIVDVATSGAEALDRLETGNTIDIVVLDIQMPGQDGISTLKRIKTEYPLVEVIMLTGHATVQSAVDAMKRGAFDYLIKPYDLEALLEKADNAVSRKRYREEKIADARSRPYISDREREDLISEILKES
jgi:DNA-binding NtrC family response regulator